MLPNIITKTQLTLFLTSGPKVINNTHPNFQRIKNKILNNTFTLEDDSLFDLSMTKATKSGVFKVNRSGVFFRDQKVENTVCNRIVENLMDGYPIDSLIKFLDKLLQNPFPEVVKNLYTYLEKYNLAINEDGDIVGIKSIHPNYTSIFKPSFVYPQTGYVSEPIHLLQKDPGAPCGPGLYFGFEDFVFGWGKEDSVVITVIVNPAHIIGIPADCGYQKMRAHTLYVAGRLGTVANLKGKFKVQSNIAEKAFSDTKTKTFAETLGEAFMEGFSKAGFSEAASKTAPLYRKVSNRNNKGQFVSAAGAKRDKYGRFTNK